MSEREFLVFQLTGPMAAFGDIAVGERRATWDVPSKSGVLGLVAAALGLDRSNAAAHLALDEGLGFAVRQDEAGRPLRDYHTAQAPKARKGVHWRTRREELEADDLNTVLSERIYRLEPTATIILWQKKNDAPALQSIETALKFPSYVLYLGRKACPLGRAPRPRVFPAAGVNEALAAYDVLEAEADLTLGKFFRRPRQSGPRAVWIEVAAGINTGENVKESRSRRDGLMNRTLWQFTDRTEARIDFAAPLYGETQP